MHKAVAEEINENVALSLPLHCRYSSYHRRKEVRIIFFLPINYRFINMLLKEEGAKPTID